MSALVPLVNIEAYLGVRGSVGGIESLGVPEIDLKLSAGELVVRGDNLKSERREVPQRTEQHIFWIAL